MQTEYHIGLFGPFSLKERRGNSIRILLQADGLSKIGMRDFCLYSYGQNENARGFDQCEIGETVYPKIFPLFQKIKKLPCSIVHVHHCIGAMLLRQDFILDMPSFMTLQTREIYKHEGHLLKRLLVRYIINPLFLKPIERKAILHAKRVIVASDSIKTDICRHIPEVEPDKIVTITNPVELNSYQDTKTANFVVGVAAGDFTDNMDRGCLEVLEQIAGRLPEVEFLMTGHMSKEQLDRIKRVPNVRALGRIEHRRYRKFLNDISIFLNPYLSFWDYGGSKFKLLEAAAAGLPVISTTNGAIGFPDTDKLFIADSVTEFVNCIDQLADPILRRNSGQALKSVIHAKHDHLKEAHKLKELYAEVLSES